jgi:hypothetical protein
MKVTVSDRNGDCKKEIDIDPSKPVSELFDKAHQVHDWITPNKIRLIALGKTFLGEDTRTLAELGVVKETNFYAWARQIQDP